MCLPEMRAASQEVMLPRAHSDKTCVILVLATLLWRRPLASILLTGCVSSCVLGTQGVQVPGNKTTYAVFDEESEFSGPRTPKFSLDQVF